MLVLDKAALEKQRDNLMAAANQTWNRHQQILGMLELVQAQLVELAKGEVNPPPEPFTEG